MSVSAPGQTTLTDLESFWTIHRFYLPGTVATDGFGNYLPLQGTGPNAQITYEGAGGFEEIAGEVSSSGLLSGLVSATSIAEDLGQQLQAEVSISRSGALDIFIEGETTRLIPNTGQSLLLAISAFGGSDAEGPEETEVILGTRHPASQPTTTEMAGDWTLVGAYLNDVFNSWEFDAPAPITLNSNGTGTANIPEEGEVEFTYAPGINGLVNVNVGEDMAEIWNINSSLDVMVRLNQELDENFNPENTNPAWGDIQSMNEYDFSLLVKQPESLTIEEMAGVWDVFILTSEVDYTAEDPSGGEDPDFEPFNNLIGTNTERLRIVINPDGTFEATFVDAGPGGDVEIGELTEGTVLIDENVPRLQFTADGESEDIDLVINASKDFLVRFDVETPGQTNTVLEQEIIMAVKRRDADLGLWETTPGAAAGSWLNLPWFGNIFLLDTADDQWIFHQDHGWIFILGRRLDGFWVWFPDFNLLGDDPAGIALWTSEALYPWFIRVNDDATGNNPAPGFSWVYFAEPYFDETGELWFREIEGATWVEQVPARPPSP